MKESRDENLEAQIITLYKEKEELELSLGTSDTDAILEEFESLGKELSKLYSFKENYRKVDTNLIRIDSLRAAYIPKHRFEST
ncbi:hypothetical protein LEP1GSC202_2377 [Leptospira yanagawae serovar Saopaulo str. Sao Paulo = ATCC 700523]|uniref:Uncharacterized protein n=1 Tax=Leptospira yanagawae serovar Saopaulo str. Sao Paulo = ATCC 700523 TaxID=1249483 RepID=A0A5E8H8K1_9LEPT|nr:hypothetical protein [Leptospira yanagawae]EOQ87665.1 hypothetical protein LEP1GSC202_2377 [Leptospira yanagawae serovar Saopaulo str. Sao Paulo = ATCC 700523]